MSESLEVWPKRIREGKKPEPTHKGQQDSELQYNITNKVAKSRVTSKEMSTTKKNKGEVPDSYL